MNVGVTNVYAAEKREKDVNEERGELCKADYEKINYALNYIGYSEDDSVYYTEPYQKSDEGEDIKIVSFIYDTNKIIGQYIKEERDGDVNECFIINEGTDSLNCHVKYYQGEKLEISNEEIAMEASATDGAKNNGWSTIGEGSAEYLTTFADTGKFLAPDYVANKNRYVNGIGYGLCWAACGASIVNYYRGTSYDTWGMYNELSKITGVPDLTGVPTTIRCMFGSLGLKYSELERRLTYTEVLNALDNNSLVMYGIDGKYGKHGVVLCGAFRINSYYGFIYMDPNVSGGYVLNYNDRSAAISTTGNFYYYNGQLQYTTVYLTYYNFKKQYYIK